MNLPAWNSGAVDGNYSTGPFYPAAPELAKRVGVPEGKVIEFVMNSAESKFYPGINGAFQRHVCVYVPAEYVQGTVAPAIVSADAYGMRYNLPTILDNMIYDQRLPAMVAVMIDNGGAERSMETTPYPISMFSSWKKKFCPARRKRRTSGFPKTLTRG